MNFRNLKNPTLSEYGQVHCTVEIPYGEGAGRVWEEVPYVAAPMDVSLAGNAIWAAICAGKFDVDEGHVVNFDHTQLTPDPAQEETND